jgi:phosphoribosylformimino-5-aminoimidazole carboxamide ribotide isomerase
VIVYPAIDIRDGKAVQLVEGNFAQETVFDADPVEAALRWQDAGAEWIHIVDLDGARDGDRPNRSTIERIRAAVSGKLQLGGGMRNLETIRSAHASGIDRIVIGSAAVSQPDLVPASIEILGECVAVGIDARNGNVATHGWVDQTTVSALDLVKRVTSEGIKHIIYTDIGRDGRLEGPNLAALSDVIRSTTAGVIASGGITTLNDVASVKDIGSTGVIIGTALYRKRIDLTAALELASKPEATP